MKTNNRKQRIRSKISKVSDRDRLVVHRTNSHIYAQIIDAKGKVVVSASDMEINTEKKMTKSEKAGEVGTLIASKAKDKKIKKVVFDRSGYIFHGRVKTLAEAARKGGLEF